MTTFPPSSAADDRLSFPPFPTAPPGVTIIPFKDFKERGIQMFPENDEIESDGLGIPTVVLKTRHDTDECKTQTKRQKKAELPLKTPAAPGARKEWWDIWMDNEDSKMTGPYNPHTSPLDRFYEAATDFRKTRSWPQGATGIAASWDQFRLFAGLLSNTPVWTRTDKPQIEDESEPSDDEAEFAKDQVLEAHFNRGGPKRPPPPRARARPPYALYGMEPIPVGSDQEVKALLANENARREEQMIDFLNDPELKIKIFLSSYMRKQGLIWTDRNLINIPRLVEFFIRFLIRNRVFPEPDFDRELRRSLTVIELAEKELILTSKIAKQVPDEFSKACFECFGRKSEGYKPLDPIVEADKPWPPEEETAEASLTKDESSESAEPDAKRLKLDCEADGSKAAVDKFEDELKAANVEVIKVDDSALMKEAEQLQIIRDNVNPDINTVPTWAKSEGWGLNSDDVDSWETTALDWGPVVNFSLMPFLGPTAFPITHTSGVVECSVRRVKSYSGPPAPATLPKSALTTEEDPDAVEIELERHFAKVVLSPWAGWDNYSDEMPHMARPRILETSAGPIHGVVGTAGQVEPIAGAAVTPEEGPRPHDPFNDDITLLVQPALLPVLNPGMGLGGTWVQIARAQDFVTEKRKKKKKSKKSITRYWYIDELVLTLPSYHT
ncbi:hypothetical protein C0992_001542 [Termitomyces sp. T32_za158]|nr:hypothetical protein C0992_001542 [Termitomyces sp. T32_za158]